MRYTLSTLCLAVASLSLTGCDAIGIETVPQIEAKKEAEAHAIGSACRHAVRSIESCFQSYPKAVKAAMFNGWKEMDTYMRENEIVGMPSASEPPAAEPAAGHEDKPAPEAAADSAHKS